MSKVDEYVMITLNKPKNLVLEDLIKPEFPFFVNCRRDDGGTNYKMTTGKNILKHIPALYYFVHILLERQYSDNEDLKLIYNPDFNKMFSRDIEPIKSKNDFKFIWSILQTLKISEAFSNNEPSAYKKSAMAYYFIFYEPYLNEPIVQHQIKIKKSIADKLNKKLGVNDQQIDLASIITKKHIAHQYHALQHINFDSASAINHIDKQLRESLITKAQYNTCLISINNMINHRVRVTLSDKCNRFFTPVTMMPKQIRKFIKDSQGESLIELDFGSFNAFAVYKIINSIDYDFQSNIDKILFEQDINLYRNLLAGGDFYGDFKEVFFPDEELTRDQVKEIVLHLWMNGKVNSKNKYKKIIDKRMPKISSILTAIKSENYKNFSNTTMKMESELVNDIIYKKFIELHPDAIMYTIFDSFLVEQKYSALLHSMMLEEGSRYFNLNCVVKAKR